MRTLKKVLALSLVFAMAFTMMAGAAFKDQDKIDSSLNSDIQLLTALGVFKGDENGNFNPTANVKRSEAAKMIYVLKNNGVDDGAVAFQGVSKYADVPVGHWAEGYINYCTNLGYMGGWKEGNVQKFDPNGNVTGVELTKMLLCMIGYKADVQSYTGNGWQTNVLQDAATSGLSVEYVPSFYAAAPRQWTARLMTNAIDANYVVYSKGELTFKDETYGEFALKLHTAEGILMNAGKVALDNASAPTKVDLNENGDQIELANTATNPVSPANAPTTFKTTVDASLLGQYVKVYYRAGTTADTHKVYAVLATGKSKVYDTTLGDVTVGTYAGGETIKFEGYNGGSAKKYANTNSHIYLVKNLNNVTDVVPDSTSSSTTTFDKHLAGNSTAAIRFVDQDGNGTIDLAFTDATVYGKVKDFKAEKNVLKLDDANNSAITLNGMSGNVDTEEEFKKLNIEGNIAKDDVVATTVDTTSGKVVINVKKVEPVKATVSGYTVKGSNYETLKINGTDYKLAKAPMNGYTWALDTVNKHDNFYTDGKFVVFSTGAKAGATIDNLAYVIDSKKVVGTWGTTYEVKVLLSGGTQGTYVVDAVYDELGVKVANANTVVKDDTAGTSLNGTNLTKADRYKKVDGNPAVGGDAALDKLFDGANPTAKNRIFTYSMNDNKIVLNTINPKAQLDGKKATYMANSADYTNATPTYTDGIAFNQKTDIATIGTTQYRTTEDSYFFAVDTTNKKYSVVKAADLKQDVVASVNVRNMFVAQDVNGFATLLVGVINLDDAKTAKALDYYFITDKSSYTGVVDGKHVVELPVNAAGKESNLTFKYDAEATANAAMAQIDGLQGKLVTVTLKADGSVDIGVDTQGLKVVDTDPLTTAPAATKWYDGVLTAWDGTNAVIGGQIVKIASDVKIFNVDVKAGEKNKLVAGDTIVLSDSTNTSVVAYVNADKEISVIFCEVDGADITTATGIVLD